jgi:hypothetical protein
MSAKPSNGKDKNPDKIYRIIPCAGMGLGNRQELLLPLLLLIGFSTSSIIELFLLNAGPCILSLSGINMVQFRLGNNGTTPFFNPEK